MKNSTIIVGVSALVLLGAGAYIYFKGKKSPSKDSLGEASKPVSKDSTESIPPKATIDMAVSAFSETQTENYKKAKVISKEVEVLTNRLRNLEIDKKKESAKPFTAGNYMAGIRANANKDTASIIFAIRSVQKQMSEKTAQANALGYKILPYGEIEKI
jgi:hypothetical protein